MKHHVVSVKIYLAIFAALIVLTFVTVWVAEINFGFLNDVVAMSIAVIKMTLVAMFFMHLKYSARLLWLVAGAGLIWLVIMFALTLSDYQTRDLLRGGEAWAQPPAVEQTHAPAEAHH